MKLKRKLLVSAICTAMLVPFPVVSTLAQDAASEQSREDVQRLEPVTVIGSLIPQAQVEAVTPIIIILSQDIQRQAFGKLDLIRGWQLSNRLINGEFRGLTGTQGIGKRDNWAAAVKFRVPTFSMLTANVSGHYDDYKNKGGGVRHDSTPNYLADGYAVAGAKKVDALWLFNATFDYAVSDDISLTFTVNNLLDESPSRDDTYTYNGYERSGGSAMAEQTDCYQGKGAGPAHAGPVFLRKGSA